MEIIVICLVGSLTLLLIGILTNKYKKRYRKKLDKKDHPLKMLYGISFFLIDKFIGANKISVNKKSEKALKKIHLKEDIRHETYLYIAQKLSFCIVAFAITMFLGIGIGVTEYNKDSRIESLERNSTGDGYKAYDFNVKYSNGEEESVKIDIEEKKLKSDEAYKILTKAKPKILKEMLNENISADSVTKPLNLISTYGKQGISILWKTSNNDLIDYNGKIVRNVKPEGELVDIVASLELEGVMEEYRIKLCVKPSNQILAAQDFLQQKVNEDKYSKVIELPKIINGKKVVYSIPTQNGSWVIVFLGLIGVVVIFFYKDKELDKQINQRNRQMIKDYPEIVSRLLLYNSAGMSLRTSIEKIVSEHKQDVIRKNLYKKKHYAKGNKKQSFYKVSYAYEEMEMALNKMKSGINEEQALYEFGKRCGQHCYIKLANILQQNIKRGTKELAVSLQDEITNAFQDRKNNALKEGEEASTKLLGPMILMLIIALAIIVVPAFLSIKLQ